MPPRGKSKRTRQSLTKENQSQNLNQAGNEMPLPLPPLAAASISSANIPELLPEALKSLNELSNHKFALLDLVEEVQRRDPSSSSDDDGQTSHSIATPSSTTSRRSSRSKKPSDVSDNTRVQTALTPASLINDLAHYGELYSKYKFTYLEQFRKERFIERIMDDGIELRNVEQADINELQEAVDGDKQVVSAEKKKMIQLIRELEISGRSLGSQYEELLKRKAELEGLPAQIELLKEEIQGETAKVRGTGRKKRARRSSSDKSIAEEEIDDYDDEDITEMNLPLDETFELVRAQEAELENLQRELEKYEAVEIPRKKRIHDGLEKQIKPLEIDRKGLVEFVDKVVRMREGERAEGRADRENIGRWHKAAKGALSHLAN